MSCASSESSLGPGLEGLLEQLPLGSLLQPWAQWELLQPLLPSNSNFLSLLRCRSRCPRYGTATQEALESGQSHAAHFKGTPCVTHPSPPSLVNTKIPKSIKVTAEVLTPGDHLLRKKQTLPLSAHWDAACAPFPPFPSDARGPCRRRSRIPQGLSTECPSTARGPARLSVFQTSGVLDVPLPIESSREPCEMPVQGTLSARNRGRPPSSCFPERKLCTWPAAGAQVCGALVRLRSQLASRGRRRARPCDSPRLLRSRDGPGAPLYAAPGAPQQPGCLVLWVTARHPPPVTSSPGRGRGQEAEPSGAGSLNSALRHFPPVPAPGQSTIGSESSVPECKGGIEEQGQWTIRCH